MPPRQAPEAGRALTVDESRDLRRTLVHWLVVVVVLVSVVSSVLNWVLVDRAPEDPVDAWLGGIADGRSRQLLSRAEAVREDPRLDVVPNRVYRGADGRISGHEILDVRRSGGRAEVRARVWWDAPREGGPRHEEVHTYRVHLVERTGPFNDLWELDSQDAAQLAIHLPALLDELSVNGESIRPDADSRVPDPRGPGGIWSFEALPGEYAVGLPGNSYYAVARSLPPVTLPFRDPGPVPVELRIEPSPRMWQETDERIEKWLEDCMEAEELFPEGCPSSRRHALPEDTPGPSEQSPAVSRSAGEPEPEITDVQWRLVSRPALVLVPAPEDRLLWRADTYRPAEARLSYREEGQPVTERIEFPVPATVRSTGQSARIEVGPR